MMPEADSFSEPRSRFLYPSHVVVSRDGFDLHTLLGSCVAVCLYDPVVRCGGMNHYMVPSWNGEGLESPKYGNIAIDMLLQKMLDVGAQKHNLVAKVFGGASQYYQNSILNVGERNVMIARTMLEKLRIRVVANSIGGNRGRKIAFNTDNGDVMLKYIVSNELNIQNSIDHRLVSNEKDKGSDYR